MKVHVELRGRDQISAEKLPDGKVKWTIIACPQLRQILKALRSQHSDQIENWPLPTAKDHASLLVRELILKWRGEFKFPYPHDEVCHCRAISTAKVDEAIMAGAHDTLTVSAWTTASTSCTTCRPDVQLILDFRLGSKDSISKSG